MPSRETLLRRLQYVRDSFVEIAEALADIRLDILDAVDRAMANGHYGIADIYRSASDQAENIADILAAADDGLQSAIGSIAAIGNAHDPAPSTAPPHAALNPADAVERRSPGLFDPVEAETVTRKRIGRHVGTQKTVGQLVGADGCLIGNEIWSGRKGPGEGGPGLVFRWNHMETMLEHVEGHAAAIMRRDNIQEATLIISRRPCDDEPYGCEWTLPDCLPKDSRLTVKTVDRAGRLRRVRVFIGTGRAIDRDRP